MEHFGNLWLMALFENIPTKIKIWYNMCEAVLFFNAQVSGDVMMCRWSVAKNRTIGEKGLR